MSSRATIHDVAKRAGVSVATVSRVLNSTAAVSQDTEDRVRSAVAELNFSLSQSASTLATGRTMRVGILLPQSLSSWFNSHVLEGIYRELEKSHYEVVPYIMWDEETLTSFFKRLPARGNVDAFIVVSFNLSEQYLHQLDTMNVPCIGVDTPMPDGFDAFVGIDDKQSMLHAVRLLHGMGHSHIAYFARSSQERLASSLPTREMGFTQAIREVGLKPNECPVLDVDNDMTSVLGAMISLQPRPTAICAEDDQLAYSIIKGLRSLGFSVPQDFSVLGFDDQAVATMADLSTIHQDPNELGAIAAQSALRLIHEHSSENNQSVHKGAETEKPYIHTVPTSFVMRSSVRGLTEGK